MASGQECQHLEVAKSLTAEEQKGVHVLVDDNESNFSEKYKVESKPNYSGDFLRRCIQIIGSNRSKI